MMMCRISATFVLGAMALGSIGCSFIARGPKRYEEDTRKLLESNNSSLKQCYDALLKNDQSAQGTVVVKFDVTEESGAITGAEVVDGSAPQGLKDCVVKSIDGLKLAPADARLGKATYTYEFEIAPQRPPKDTPSTLEVDEEPSS